MSDQEYNLDDYISISSGAESEASSNHNNTIDGIRSNSMKEASSSQSYNVTESDVAYLKTFNTSKITGQDLKSASSVGSTKTIDSVKRPSDNFLSSFFSKESVTMVNKSPPRPHSPGEHMDFINMTSFNLQKHNNLTNSTFDLYSKNNESTEDVLEMLSADKTPIILTEEKRLQRSKDSLVLSYVQKSTNVDIKNNVFEGFQPPTRASTGTTTDHSDIVMSHQSQPSTVTAGTSNEDKNNVNMIYSPEANSENASQSPKNLTGNFSSTILEEDPNTDINIKDSADKNNALQKQQQRQVAIGLAQSVISPEIKETKDDSYESCDYQKSGINFDQNHNSNPQQNPRYMFQNSSPDLVSDGNYALRPGLKNSKSHVMDNCRASNSNKLCYQMTPSQRLRYRREQNKNKVKNSAHFKEYAYDKLENIEKMYYQHGNIYSQPPPSICASGSVNSIPKKKLSLGDSPLIWNVPMSKNQVNMDGYKNIPSSNKNSKNAKRLSQSSASMPMTAVYGVSDRKDLIDDFNQTVISLSDLYIHETDRQKEDKVNQRKLETEFLPESLKEATKEGFEDPKFVSKEKLNSLSSSRPSWLPVKDCKENEKHEKEIFRTVSNASLDKLQMNRKFDCLPDVVAEMKIKFDKLFNVESEEDQIINSTSIFNALSKILWEYPCVTGIDNRYNFYHKLLLGDIYSAGFFPEEVELEKFPGFDYSLKMNPEIYQLIKQVLSQYNEEASVENRLHSFRKIPQILFQMVYMRQSSCKGSDIKRCIVLYDVLLRSYGLIDVELAELQHFENRTEIEYVIRKLWDLEQLLSKICFNKLVVEKYNDRIMNKKGLVSQSLKMEYGFDLEFASQNLNFDNFLQILNKLPSKICLWVLDIIVLSNTVLMNKNDLKYYLNKLKLKSESFSGDKKATYDYWLNKYSSNNYKVLVALTLSVLLNYHFGYADFKELGEISLMNYNLLGVSNRPILDILLSEKPISSKKISRLSRNATSLSMSRSSSGFFVEPRHSSLASTSIRSSQLNIVSSDYDCGTEDGDSVVAEGVPEIAPTTIETLDFMNLTSLDTMGVRNYSCQEEDEEDYISMEGFVKKWYGYYKKL